MSTWHKRFCEWQYEFLINSLILSTRDLNRYVDLIENTFSEMLDNQIDPLTDDEAVGISEQERRRFDDYYAATIFDKHKFPEEFYKSFVMSLFSKIEKEMIGLCEQELELKLIVSPSDTEALGSGIYRAQKFLAQAAGYTIENLLWQELQIIGKVRNRLVHNDSPYIAPLQKPNGGSIVKIHVESGRNIQDYYLPIELALHKHVSKLKILEYLGASTKPGNELAWFEISPSYNYCRYLIDFRKRLFLHIYNGLLEIAKLS